MDKHPTDAGPQTLLEAVAYFRDPQVAHDFFVEQRWPNGVTCPTCGSRDVVAMPKYRRWLCRENHERRQFSAKVGSIFEDSPLGFDKWLPAMWLILNAKNGISSHELGRAVGVTQKSAWHMLHRLRLVMQTGSFEKMSGLVEADETFVGGLSKNMHKATREKKIPSYGPYGSKTIVMGFLNRGVAGKKSRVKAKVIKDTQRATLHAEIAAHVEPGSAVYTDAWRAYRDLPAHFVHEFVDHATAYVKGQVHTNGLENFWTLLKRAIKGTYVNVEPFHLFRYVDEQAFRFNERGDDDGGRFLTAIRQATGKRLMFRDLIAKPA